MRLGVVIIVGLGVFVGWWILRLPLMRSVRVLALVMLCTGAALLAFQIGTVWSSIAAAALTALPFPLALRFQEILSALPPADFHEHHLIESIRESLRVAYGSPPRVEDARRQLTTPAPPAREWQAVRDALLAQVDLAEKHAAGAYDVDVDEVVAFAHRTAQAWRAAVDARRRFFR